MSKTYSLAAGLVVGIGEARWELRRLLDNATCQLENQTTGRVRHVQISSLTHNVITGQWTIVRPSIEKPSSSPTGEPRSLFCPESLNNAQKDAYLRAHTYVRSLRLRGITKGQRARVCLAIPEIANEIGDPLPPKSSTVMRWMRMHERSGNDPASLIAKSARRVSSPRISARTAEIIRNVLQRYYFKRAGVTLVMAHALATNELEKAANRGDLRIEEATASPSTVRRIAAEVSPYDRDRIRLGMPRARATWRFSEKGQYATRPLERVEMDHTLLDLWVIDDDLGIPLGRPTLTLLACTYSGYINSFFISFEGESLARMIRSIKIAIEPKDKIVGAAKLDNPWHAHGLWETLVVDNARACHSEQFKQIGIDLCMDIEYCPVRQPWFKPVIERFIGEICQQLPNPGKPSKPGRHPDPINPQSEACVTFSDLCAGILKWVVDVHPFTINQRKLARPIDLYLEGLDSCPAPVFVESYASLDVLAGLTKTSTVDHNGIVCNWIQYASDDLRRMRHAVGTKFKATYKLDPYDLGQIHVQHPKDKTWVTVPAKNQEYAAGLTLTQHKLIRQAAKSHLTQANAERELRRSRLALQEHWSQAIRSGKRLKESRRIGQTHNRNSVDALDPRKRSTQSVRPETILPDDQLSFSNQPTPSFTTFLLNDR
ncbi:Mu transposase C-terminal domain-containing protein [Pandoraea communis]|uniref:Mu transposase C-terminal domain-containing protein n=1 Tax=Pandoraea communis TaxID=2508297 RepID=UPI0025A5E50A|nr:Mu transposase C-terminal domain-containing protein [Pandoraea communis]MDM8359049.1 Mu transposase C-terminal domain-containing protein [Pandoraea communis]